MKHGKYKLKRIFFISLLFLTTGVVGVLTPPATGKTYQEGDYALLIQQMPVDAGRISPLAGVHRVGINEVATLTAIPKPGYRFVYWLGDVTEPGSYRTTIIIDSPKMVIAVFERTEFEIPLEIAQSRHGIGRSGVTATPGIGMGPGISTPPRYFEPSEWAEPEPPEPTELPVPSEDTTKDIPVPEDKPIPEPATMTLLGLGVLLMNRRKKNHSRLKRFHD